MPSFVDPETAEPIQFPYSQLGVQAAHIFAGVTGLPMTMEDGASEAAIGRTPGMGMPEAGTTPPMGGAGMSMPGLPPPPAAGVDMMGLGAPGMGIGGGAELGAMLGGPPSPPMAGAAAGAAGPPVRMTSSGSGGGSKSSGGSSRRTERSEGSKKKDEKSKIAKSRNAASIGR